VMALPILFILFCAFGIKTINAHSSIAIQNILGNDDSVFHSVERYLIKHLHYPESSLKANYVATVNVKITVDATGKCKTITPVEAIPADTKFYAVNVHSLSKFANSGFKPPVVEPDFNKNEFVPFKETVTKTLSEFKSDKPENSEVTFYLKVSFKIDQNNKTSLEFTKPINSTGRASFVQPIIVHELPAVIDTVPDIVFTKVEVEASYPGGQQGWQDYLVKTFRYPDEAVNKEVQGTIVIEYIVDKQGNVSDVKAISGTKKGGLREEAIRVIKNSGKWIPAIQNGHPVSAYKKQPIQFKLQNQ